MIRPQIIPEVISHWLNDPIVVVKGSLQVKIISE